MQKCYALYSLLHWKLKGDHLRGKSELNMALPKTKSLDEFLKRGPVLLQLL